VLAANGELDRRALGKIVFSDPVALADLDRITHPAISDEIERRVQRLEAPLVAIEAVKLSQAGVGRLCDETWLITCDRDVQLARLRERNGLSVEEGIRRIDAQISYDPSRFHRVIQNTGDKTALSMQVTEALAEPLGSFEQASGYRAWPFPK
jgi:dephospho-CoA kinase